jgi:hypothetical protein
VAPKAHHNDDARDKRGRKRGKSQRAHDHDALPLHMGCHGEFTERRGFCDGWSSAQREAWQKEQADAVWARWISTPEGKDAVRYVVPPKLGREEFFGELDRFRARLPTMYGFELELILDRYRAERF